ncbi:MAG: sigma-70 family RNA polymerase sigma factor [Planctomycetota bacterium]
MSLDPVDNPQKEDHRTEPRSDPRTEAMVQLAKHWASAMPAIEAFVGSAVRDPNDRDDVIQATSEYLARNFEDFEPGTSFTGWAVQVARYRVMELFRDRSRDKLMLTGDALEAVACVVPEVSDEQSDRAQALDQCMQHLGENQRRLLELRYTRSLSPAMIADRMGKSSNTISAALLRIRKALRKCIETRLAAIDSEGKR